MFKLVYFVSGFIFYIIALLIDSCVAFRCIHDQVTVQKRSVSITEDFNFQNVREERERDPKLFEPLQIHFYLDDFDRSVSANALYNIEQTVNKIRDVVAKTFQVRKRKNPFVLERKGCVKKWQSGINRGKCSNYRSEIEVCSAKELLYMIPDRFLSKLEVFDYEGSKPRYVDPSGPGLLESNCIIFVTSQISNFCEGMDVSAYGTYCRLDEKTNEPLAGILNLCPSYFASKIYPSQHYYNVILHEVFHILGFSLNLFEKFLPCQKGIYCDVPKTIIQQDSAGISRMLFPLVVKNMQEHFSCSESNFGGPMAAQPLVENSTDDKPVISSHWHPVLMYSSVMTPKFSEYDHIFVDNITLAVFASTGWYRINYANADAFTFGLNEGCNFGVNVSSCENSLYLCDPNLNATGCDLVHKTIGRCTKRTPDHPCGIYEPFTSESCISTQDKHYGLDFYALGYKHKCFMQQDPGAQFMPICYPVKCRSEDTYEILVNMTWKSCNFRVGVYSNNTFILCPDSFLFCTGASVPAVPYFCPTEDNFFIAVRLYFKLPLFEDLSKYQNFKNFKVTTLRAIAENMDIPTNYIVNATLSVFKQIYMDFSICPPTSLDTNDLNTVLNKIQKFLDSGAFMHILKGQEDMIISSLDLKINPLDAIAFSDHEGFGVLLIFPVLCAIFLVTTFVASLLRLVIDLINKPQRDLTTIISENIPLSDILTPS